MKNSNILGKDYPLTSVDEAANTKEKILVEATLMFARQGYVSVSIRDLAKVIGIKPASLYNHFESKENLWNAVLDHMEDLYKKYFQRLEAVKNKAQSFEDVLDSMFVELMEVVNVFTYYGFSLVLTEQFHQKRNSELFVQVFMKYAIDFIADEFDWCVEQGWVGPFDTRAIAQVFMNNVQMGMVMRVQEDMGNGIPYEIAGMYTSLKNMIRHCAVTGFGAENFGKDR